MKTVVKYIDLKNQPIDLSGCQLICNTDLYLEFFNPKYSSVPIKEVEQFGSYLAVRVPEIFANNRIGIMARPNRFSSGQKNPPTVYIQAFFVMEDFLGEE